MREYFFKQLTSKKLKIEIDITWNLCCVKVGIVKYTDTCAPDNFFFCTRTPLDWAMLRQCGLAAVPNLIFYYLVAPPVDGIKGCALLESR
jgi:hypothetical protein